MLYEVFCKVIMEADEPGNQRINVDCARMNATCSFNIGNLVKISFELKFFQKNDVENKSEVGEFFRKIFLNIA